MVIVNPRLSLPTDLPYKKRQRQFFSNTPLQQATIRYNEAIRKKYNDIQFAKRLETGSATQNEVTGVNTVEISKLVDPTLFTEMSTMNPISPVKKRRSKRYDVSPHGHGHTSTGSIIGASCTSSRLASSCSENSRQLNSPKPEDSSSTHINYDCNNNEMFPHLHATVNTSGGEKKCSSNYTNIKPQSSSSLEAQAINEYEPTNDSMQDMIFGDVIGMDYNSYIPPGPLWTPNQGCGNNSSAANEQSPNFHTPPPSLCCPTKLVQGGCGYMQEPAPGLSVPSPPPPLMYEINSSIVNGNACTPVMNPLPIMGKHGGPGRRSTSVPRPRKETLKQAAIRCGIIKGNHTVAAIPKRSHCLMPLQLAPVQSDPIVSVVEILHPKGTLPACSSEALVEFEDFKFKTTNSDCNNSDIYVIHNNRSTPALNIVMINGPGESANLENTRTMMGKSNSEGYSQVPSEADPSSRNVENAISCPTL